MFLRCLSVSTASFKLNIDRRSLDDLRALDGIFILYQSVTLDSRCWLVVSTRSQVPCTMGLSLQDAILFTDIRFFAAPAAGGNQTKWRQHLVLESRFSKKKESWSILGDLKGKYTKILMGVS